MYTDLPSSYSPIIFSFKIFSEHNLDNRYWVMFIRGFRSRLVYAKTIGDVKSRETSNIKFQHGDDGKHLVNN